VQGVFLTLILLVLPLHPLIIFVFLAHMIIRNVLGHAGVELLPRTWLAGWWGRCLTTTLHHDLHHSHGRHNYGLYFTWWDRIGGTEHPEYRARLQQLIGSLGGPVMQGPESTATCTAPTRRQAAAAPSSRRILG
jgi:sterol desaturase/sphingolipid hydroxylase (fatty acid hydroxylase superfamily)